MEEFKKYVATAELIDEEDSNIEIVDEGKFEEVPKKKRKTTKKKKAE